MLKNHVGFFSLVPDTLYPFTLAVFEADNFMWLVFANMPAIGTGTKIFYSFLTIHFFSKL